MAILTNQLKPNVGQVEQAASWHRMTLQLQRMIQFLRNLGDPLPLRANAGEPLGQAVAQAQGVPRDEWEKVRGLQYNQEARTT